MAFETRRLNLLLALLAIISPGNRFAAAAAASPEDHRYNVGDPVPLFANRVGPLHNPRYLPRERARLPPPSMFCVSNGGSVVLELVAELLCFWVFHQLGSDALAILGLLSPFEIGVIRLSEVDLVLELTLLVFATGMSISIQVQQISNASCSCCVMSGSTWGFLSKIVWCSRRCECPVKICLISLPFLLWLFSCNTRV